MASCLALFTLSTRGELMGPLGVALVATLQQQFPDHFGAGTINEICEAYKGELANV